MNAATLRLSIKQWAPEDRPTERLQRLGTDSLTDAELLAILIGSGTSQYSAVDIAKHVLGKFGGDLNTLGKARFDEFEDIEGVGTQTACKIMAAVEFLPCKHPSAERGKRRFRRTLYPIPPSIALLPQCLTPLRGCLLAFPTDDDTEIRVRAEARTTCHLRKRQVGVAQQVVGQP